METTIFDIKVKRMHKLESAGSLKAYADIILNDVLLIKGLKVVDGTNGLFISMPSEKAKDNKWYDSVRCLNKDIRQQITDEVIATYESDC